MVVWHREGLENSQLIRSVEVERRHKICTELNTQARMQGEYGTYVDVIKNFLIVTL